MVRAARRASKKVFNVQRDIRDRPYERNARAVPTGLQRSGQ